MDLELTPVEARVLGSLLEKERAVPATYPLTMKALLTACNQTSSRDPIMDLSEAEVEGAVESLKAHKLVRRVLPSHGNRTVKYRQVADQALTLDAAQRAIVTVLLLRGPQTPQELRARTERLHRFDDPAEVEATLDDMAAWGDPLVRLLPRRSGQRDARWAHLLAGKPVEPDPSAGAALGAAPVASVVPAESPVPAPDPSLHGPLVPLVGTWVVDGVAPSAEGGGHREEADRLEVVPVPGERLLTYRARAGANGTSSSDHVETGFFRLTAHGDVELVVATASGTVEVCTGLADLDGGGLEVVVSSEKVAATPTASEHLTGTERIYRVVGDTLAFDLSVASGDRPLTHHIGLTLTRLG